MATCSASAAAAAARRTAIVVMRARGDMPVPYEAAMHTQQEISEDVRKGQSLPALLLFQVDHTYTLGRRPFNPSHLKDPLNSPEDLAEAAGAALVRTRRGGQITYHGPGQVMAWPVLKLKEMKLSPRCYVQKVQDALVATVQEVLYPTGSGADVVTGGDSSELTGVWVEDRKIASIGVEVGGGGITGHGMALNVDTDLGYFHKYIHACGLDGVEMTTLCAELIRQDISKKVGVHSATTILQKHLMEKLGLEEARGIESLLM